jgi:hypothetical protein
MDNWHSQYPDISDILARKISGRRQNAALSFAEKLAMLDALKERVNPLVKARKVRMARQVRGTRYALVRDEGVAGSNPATPTITPPD